MQRGASKQRQIYEASLLVLLKKLGFSSSVAASGYIVDSLFPPWGKTIVHPHACRDNQEAVAPNPCKQWSVSIVPNNFIQSYF